MTYQTISLTQDERGIATILLNRPDKHHAMNRQMIDEMTQAFRHLADDKAARVIVLASTGPTFCAGGDLGWMQEQMAADRAGKMAEARARVAAGPSRDRAARGSRKLLRAALEGPRPTRHATPAIPRLPRRARGLGSEA